MPLPLKLKKDAAPATPAPIDFAAALAVLFPGIDLLRDVILRDDADGRGVYIAEWNRPEAQPTIEQLAAVLLPEPNLALTARQARLWLLGAGLGDDDVRKKIGAIKDDRQRAAALIEWEYSVEIHLNHPLVQSIGTALRLDAEKLRAAFESAMTL